MTLIKAINEEVSPHLTEILFLVCFISNNRYSLNKWQRLDARGNKKGIDAQFSINEASWLYNSEKYDEKDYPIIYRRPHPKIIAV